MSFLDWIGTGALDFVMSVCGIVVALHFDLEGRWHARHVRRGRRLEERARRAAGLDTEPPIR